MQDQISPSGKWEFDESVALVFDDMLNRSIPQLNVMRQLVSSLASSFVKADTAIIDLGTSQGATLQSLSHLPVKHIGIEISKPMADYAKALVPFADIRQLDLRYEYPEERSCVALSILTLQFTPIEYRLAILKRVYDSLIQGGAFIIVEKVLGSSALIDEILISHYYDLKRANGYTQDQINRKRLSLEGVLVPVTAKWNEELLHMTGFSQVDCFWRWLNFSGWVAVK